MIKDRYYTVEITKFDETGKIIEFEKRSHLSFYEARGWIANTQLYLTIKERFICNVIMEDN